MKPKLLTSQNLTNWVQVPTCTRSFKQKYYLTSHNSAQCCPTLNKKAFQSES